MTDTVLFCLTAVLLVLASRAKATLLFVCVLFAVFWIDWLLAGAGGYRFIPWVDAIAVYPLVLLTIKNLKYWSVSTTLLSAAVLPVHVWYWSEWAKGEWHPEPYKLAANSLFVLSIAVLAVGDTNVRQFIGTVLGVLDRAIFRASPLVRPSRRDGEQGVEEAGEVSGISPYTVRRLRIGYVRLGAWLSGRFSIWRVRDVARQEEAP